MAGHLPLSGPPDVSWVPFLGGSLNNTKLRDGTGNWESTRTYFEIDNESVYIYIFFLLNKNAKYKMD